MGQRFSGPRLEDVYYPQKVKLGEGAFASVWRAVHIETKDIVAIKQVDKKKMSYYGSGREDIVREIETMKACVHQNITRLHATFEDNRYMFLALEYCDGGDLGDKVREKGASLEEQEAVLWMWQICAAVGLLHSKEIVHRDVKPDNFMIRKGVLKLADFGLAMPIRSGEQLFDRSGTPAYMSPEQHALPAGRGYGLPVDVWAAGLILHILICNGKHPFIDSYEMLDLNRLMAGRILDGGLWHLLDASQRPRFSEAAKDLCRRMVDPQPEKRWAIDAVIQDPWLEPARVSMKQCMPGVGQATASDPQAKIQSLEQQLALAEEQIRAAQKRELSLREQLSTNKANAGSPASRQVSLEDFLPSFILPVDCMVGSSEVCGPKCDCEQRPEEIFTISDQEQGYDVNGYVWCPINGIELESVESIGPDESMGRRKAVKTRSVANVKVEPLSAVVKPAQATSPSAKRLENGIGSPNMALQRIGPVSPLPCESKGGRAPGSPTSPGTKGIAKNITRY